VKNFFGVFHEIVLIMFQPINFHAEGAFGDDIHGKVAENSGCKADKKKKKP